jgi:hypothetical protein
MKLVSKHKLKQFVKPWITKGIRAPLKLKTNYMPLVMKLSINVTEIAYACSLTRLSKKQYYYDYFNTHLTDMKKTWAGNHILNRKIKNNKEISGIKDHNNNNEIVRDHSCASNMF